MHACALLGHNATDRSEPPACTRCGRTIREETTVLWFGLLFLAVTALVTAAAVAMLRRGRKG